MSKYNHHQICGGMPKAFQVIFLFIIIYLYIIDIPFPPLSPHARLPNFCLDGHTLWLKKCCANCQSEKILAVILKLKIFSAIGLHLWMDTPVTKGIPLLRLQIEVKYEWKWAITTSIINSKVFHKCLFLKKKKNPQIPWVAVEVYC